MSTSLVHRLVDAANLSGTFTLRSGIVTDTYFDKYQFESQPALLREIAEQLVPFVPAETEVIAGLELGAIPLATMLSQLTNLPTSFVRKKSKGYGTDRLAEGAEIAHKRVLIVEDVITSGGQVIESTTALRALGAHITDVICVIDRESGGVEALAEHELTMTALFRKSDLLTLEGE